MSDPTFNHHSEESVHAFIIPTLARRALLLASLCNPDKREYPSGSSQSLACLFKCFLTSNYDLQV